jgi:hypothetical protein
MTKSNCPEWNESQTKAPDLNWFAKPVMVSGLSSTARKMHLPQL